jgi:hypothetical protein
LFSSPTATVALQCLPIHLSSCYLVKNIRKINLF